MRTLLTPGELLVRLHQLEQAANREPVSYTHLDVYKRQVSWRGYDRPLWKKNSETCTWNDQSETADFLNKNDNGCSNKAI